MVVRGDGTLVSAEFAQSCPVETILSGPAASVIGAQYLSATDDMIVSDIGGTTTDVAMIAAGEPRLSVDGASVNGWRTMVKAVQIETHGLGGDSEIQYDRQQRRFVIGPHKVTPLCALAAQYPAVISDLQKYVEEPWGKTNMARFIVLRRDPGELRLTAQQQSMVRQVAEHPQSMQSVFAERHFALALRRLIEMGVLTLSAFTPTDAAHVCGWYSHWESEASLLGATLLSRYSKFNLGRSWADEKAFCQSMLAQVSRESALCIVTSAINEVNGEFGKVLPAGQRRLLDQMFTAGNTGSGRGLLSLRAGLNTPVVGIGAPAQSFYPAMSDYLDVEVVVPEHAEVANAVGAVVGMVRQSVQLTITPVSGERVMVHAPQEQREFEALEPAAAWAAEIATALATSKAEAAGGSEIKVTVDRSDNVVEHQGQRTFFESTVVATASGRVA
jgi:N-methylhydantoinase A/oxoprolinase/acetone carboxylase beta subunit